MRVFLTSAVIALISFTGFGCQSTMAPLQNEVSERPLSITGGKNGSTVLLQSNQVSETAFKAPLSVGHN